MLFACGDAGQPDFVSVDECGLPVDEFLVADDGRVLVVRDLEVPQELKVGGCLEGLVVVHILHYLLFPFLHYIIEFLLLM